jgi:acetyl esterase/lipase
MTPVLTIATALSLVLAHQQALAQSAGVLSAAEPVAVTPANMQAWRVRYWTTDDRERPIEVTGMVVAPRNSRPATQRPVLAWAHGTSGVVERCAPSLSEKFFIWTPGLNEAIRRGYTVVAPDYPGLGSAMPHPYLGGVATARSVLDAVRSARGIPGAAASARFAVWGESQGGHAALWTGQLARAYAPDLQLVGVAAAAPPTDLVENLRAGGNPSVRAFLTAFVVYSWSQHFGAPLSTLGNRTTQGVITRLARNNCNEPGMKPRLGTMLGTLSLRNALKNVDLGLIQPWARIARENSPAAKPHGTPLLIAQNPNDAIVAPEVTRRFARRMCGNGARLRYLAIAGKGHQTSAADSTDATLDWIDARFAGTAAPSDCSKI